MKTHRLLFVCLGNICRSPMAEGVFAHVARQAGMGERFLLDSAGTGAWHVGEPPDARAQAAALARGIDISRQRARQVRRADFADFDLLLAMDHSNLRSLARLGGPAARDRLRLLLDFAPGTGLREVPDPYYGGEAGFEHALDLLEAASRGLLAALMRAEPAGR